MSGAGERSLPIARLVKDNEMLSEVEVASVVAPLLERLSAMHARGQVHGNVSLATVVIKVVGPADGTVHLPDPECCAAHRPCAACQQTTEGPTHASDIWSVGIIALQLLLGRPCRDGCSVGLVDRVTGDMPVLPRGTSLECIDFLMDCLALREEDRATAPDLAKHDFLRTIAAPAGPQPTDESVDLLTESLADALLIEAPAQQQKPACRPLCVPSLQAKGHVTFTAPSHTARCLHCRSRMQCGAHHVPHPEDAMGERVDQASPWTFSPARKLKMLSPATHSAASTKRKLSPLAPAATSKRKRSEQQQQPSKIAKYLSPAILPMVGEALAAPYIEV
jgi:serine/threonine protein kinase